MRQFGMNLGQVLFGLRRGDRAAIALRSMVINLSSTALPLAFGAAGAAVGVAALFWGVGAVTAAGSWPARRLRI